MSKRDCAHCKEPFSPRNSMTKFCCRGCANAARLRRVARVCRECGGSFEARAGNVQRGGGRYCSRDCWKKNCRLTDEQYAANAERMSMERRGAGSPAFKHGEDADRPRRGRWGLALKGEGVCRNCGGTEHLNLHHAIPRSMYRAGRDELLNGVPLCVTCHMGWHRRFRVIYRDIFRPAEWEWLTSQRLLGQEIAAWLDDRYPARP